MMQNNKHILENLAKAARSCESWADFSNDIFSSTGLLAQLLPDRETRAQFLKSKENMRQIRVLWDDTVNRHGFIEGAQPKRKSAAVLLRIPVSLHRELKKEALEEGTSLNQLMLLKLASQLKHPLYQ